MFRFRWWLLSAALALGPSLEATPPLSTIEDVLFTADGNRFNGLVTVAWQSFVASDASDIAAGYKQVQVTNGILYVQLTPTTNASTPAIYTVQYNSNNKTFYTETWAIPPAPAPLRVQDVRLAPGTVTGSAPSPSNPPSGSNSTPSSPPAASTSLQISDVTGLQNALNIRPTEGTAFTISRAAVINASGSIDGATGNLSDCLHVNGTSGACGTSSGGTASGSFVDAEIPGGTLDGANSAFTLASVPNPGSSLQLFRNGLLLKSSGDFNLSGNALTFLSGAIPQPGDALMASYRLSVTIAGVGFVDLETPAGTLDGVNASFTLSQIPNPATSLALYRNGIRMKSGVDYTTVNNSITFTAGWTPQPGDVLMCSYRVAQ